MNTPTIYMLQGPPRRLEPIRREDCARLNDGIGVDGMPLVAVADYDVIAKQNAALVAENAHLHKSLDVAADCAFAKDKRLVALQEQHAALVAKVDAMQFVVNAASILEAAWNNETADEDADTGDEVTALWDAVRKYRDIIRKCGLDSPALHAAKVQP